MPSICVALAAVTIVWFGSLSTAHGQVCPVDCSGDGEVAVNDLLTCVNIVLGDQLPEVCAHCDTNGDRRVDVSDLIAAARGLVGGSCVCPTSTEELHCPPFSGDACEAAKLFGVWRITTTTEAGEIVDEFSLGTLSLFRAGGPRCTIGGDCTPIRFLAPSATFDRVSGIRLHDGDPGVVPLTIAGTGEFSGFSPDPFEFYLIELTSKKPPGESCRVFLFDLIAPNRIVGEVISGGLTAGGSPYDCLLFVQEQERHPVAGERLDVPLVCCGLGRDCPGYR